MKPWRIPLLAALMAALFVLAPAAFADCPPGNPECDLLPPESEQVNPDPEGGVGLAGEVAAPGSLLPVQAVIPMPLPRVAQALPGTAPVSVPGIEVPLRYQQPGDVSCGVQALGMALDGVDGAGPTSSALLGFLQGNGMMYDYGTGVEELAYAAQSFGYRGSYAFHGASLEGLATQLASGSPVVVSLGANGEGVPGHFVTVTGVTADGKWVAYNDSTLGRQVISAEEFARLWGLQGSSGVAVAANAPPYRAGVGTAGAALLTGITAAMALIATRPQTSARSLQAGDKLVPMDAQGPAVQEASAAVRRASASLTALTRPGIGGNLTLNPSEPPAEDDPPGDNWVTIRAPYIETVVVGQMVVGHRRVERRRWIPPRTEVLRAGYWTTQTRTVAYTAYRPRTRLVQRVVNVTHEVTEKVTTWVTRTIVEPVTRWVTRTRTWFERTWLGRLIRRVQTWLEPVVEWVRRTVVEPVTTWVRRTVVEPVTQWVEETFMEPYTAYRTEEEDVWVPPVTTTIPGSWETYEAWEDVTVPITEEVTRWRESVVNVGTLPSDVAQDFFDRIDAHLSVSDQQQLFRLFCDTLSLFPAEDAAAVYQQALDIFFGAFAGDGQATAASLTDGYGAGALEWRGYWNEGQTPTGAQYLDLSTLLGPNMPTHYNLCGQLAVMASLGLDLQAGLQIFSGMQTSRPAYENGEQVLDENGRPVWERITGRDILQEPREGTYGHQLATFLETAGAGDYDYAVGAYGEPPYSRDEIGEMVAEGHTLVALVNLNTNHNEGLLAARDTNAPAGTQPAHWVSILGIVPTESGEPVVRVYNPYQNREELYTWTTFEEAWSSTTGNSVQYGLVAPSIQDETP